MFHCTVDDTRPFRNVDIVENEFLFIYRRKTLTSIYDRFFNDYCHISCDLFTFPSHSHISFFPQHKIDVLVWGDG